MTKDEAIDKLYDGARLCLLMGVPETDLCFMVESICDEHATVVHALLEQADAESDLDESRKALDPWA